MICSSTSTSHTAHAILHCMEPNRVHLITVVQKIFCRGRGWSGWDNPLLLGLTTAYNCSWGLQGMRAVYECMCSHQYKNKKVDMTNKQLLPSVDGSTSNSEAPPTHQLYSNCFLHPLAFCSFPWNSIRQQALMLSGYGRQNCHILPLHPLTSTTHIHTHTHTHTLTHMHTHHIYSVLWIGNNFQLWLVQYFLWH